MTWISTGTSLVVATATVTGASPPIPFLPPLPPPDAVLAPELEQPFRASSAVTAAVRIQKLWNRLWLSHTPKAIGCIGRIRDLGAAPMVNGVNHTPQGLARACRRDRSEEHTSELQSLRHLVCRLLLE